MLKFVPETVAVHDPDADRMSMISFFIIQLPPAIF